MAFVPFGRKFVLGLAAAIASLAYFHDDITAIALPSPNGSIDDAVFRAGLELPRQMPGGSALKSVERVGDRIVLDHVLPAGQPVREAYQALAGPLCQEWRTHLRRGDISSVETRYHRTGQSASFYLHRGGCR